MCMFCPWNPALPLRPHGEGFSAPATTNVGVRTARHVCEFAFRGVGTHLMDECRRAHCAKCTRRLSNFVADLALKTRKAEKSDWTK